MSSLSLNQYADLPLGPGTDDPRWGDPAVCASGGPDITRYVVASVTRQLQADRVRLGHPVGQRVPNWRRLELDPRLGRGREEYKPPYHMSDLTDLNPGGAPFYRPQYLLPFDDRQAIEWLFNDPAGLRGHYAVSPETGEAFTLDLIKQLQEVLITLMREWQDPDRAAPHWMEHDITAFWDSMTRGKVWLEPFTAAGELTDHWLGNAGWVAREQLAARARRKGFIAEVRRQEGSDQGRDAFLASASGHQGMMGRTADVDENWSLQATGAKFLGASNNVCLQVTGALMNVNQEVYVPLRKRYRSLSIHWFGYT